MQTTDASYGSDQHGLVWGYSFSPGEAAAPIDSGAAAAWLSGGAPEGGFLWLHFSLANAACDRWLRQHLSLPQAFIESLQQTAGAMRVEQEDDALVGVLHDVLFEFSFDSSHVSTVSLCVQPRVLISARLKPLRSIDRLRAAVKAGSRFRSPAELLAQLLRDQAGVLVDIVRHSTSRVDRIEDTVLGNRIASSRADLSSLRRVLVRLQRLLAPEPAALFRLLSRPPTWIGEADLQDLRQAAEEFSAAVADSAALGERVKLLQEELTALVSEQTNRILFVLTVVTVMALPINLVAGLFGMNLGGIPLGEHKHGFVLVVSVLLSCTAVLGYVVVRRTRK